MEEWLRSQNLLSSRPLPKTWRPITLPVVLSGCKTWTLALREENRPEGIHEGDADKDIWAQEGENNKGPKETAQWLASWFVLSAKYCSHLQIKKDGIGEVSGIVEEGEETRIQGFGTKATKKETEDC